MKRFVVVYVNKASPGQFEECKRFESQREAERDAERRNFRVCLKNASGQLPAWRMSWAHEVRELFK